jgi:glycyl-tRNA synthetase beta chain
MKATADFLLEIGCEEIPAGMIPKAAEELKVILEKYLGTENVLKSSLEVFGAPRRLVAQARAVLLRQTDVTKEVTGPPKSVAYDSVGRPTRAAESFAAKQGVPVGKLSVVKTDRGEYLAVKQVIRGRTAMEILAEILPRAIQEIPWPRSMYWTGFGGPRFIRPIRWILGTLGGKTISFALAGVRAAPYSAGLRFLGKTKVSIRDTRDYERKLKSNFVLVRPEVRRKKIEREIRSLADRKSVV